MKTKVYIIESEVGWGQKVEETIEFDSRKLAVEFCRDYNEKYNPPKYKTPDWYMYARVENQKSYSMIRSDNMKEEL